MIYFSNFIVYSMKNNNYENIWLLLICSYYKNDFTLIARQSSTLRLTW